MPEVIARTGWTTGDLIDAIEGIQPTGPFELVTLQIGVNNQFWAGTPDAFRREFAALLRTAIELAGGAASRVVVLSIPDWGVTPVADGLDGAGIGREIDEFNQVVRQESDGAGAQLVEITEISRMAEGDLAMFTFDGLHPSALMYGEWVDVTEPVVRALLTAAN